MNEVLIVENVVRELRKASLLFCTINGSNSTHPLLRVGPKRDVTAYIFQLTGNTAHSCLPRCLLGSFSGKYLEIATFSCWLSEYTTGLNLTFHIWNVVVAYSPAPSIKVRLQGSEPINPQPSLSRKSLNVFFQSLFFIINKQLPWDLLLTWSHTSSKKVNAAQEGIK